MPAFITYKSQCLTSPLLLPAYYILVSHSKVWSFFWAFRGLLRQILLFFTHRLSQPHLLKSVGQIRLSLYLGRLLVLLWVRHCSPRRKSTQKPMSVVISSTDRFPYRRAGCSESLAFILFLAQIVGFFLSRASTWWSGHGVNFFFHNFGLQNGRKSAATCIPVL